jgi:hypothetical protein
MWLFQGPSFAAIREVGGIGSHTIVATLESIAAAHCLPAAPDAEWLLDPTILDASFQLAILWLRHWHDMTPLPSRCGRFRLFHPFAGEPVRCFLRARLSETGDSLVTHTVFTDGHNRLLAAMDDMEFACTRSLNRLSTPNPWTTSGNSGNSRNHPRSAHV